MSYRNLDKDKLGIKTYYNSAKERVDILDEKCAKHSTSSRTRIYPRVLFLRILESGINVHILH